MKYNNLGFATPLIIVAVMAVALLAGGGYYFLTHKTTFIKTENGDTVKVEETKDQVKMSNEDGTLIVGENVKIPADFPKTIPIYPNTTLTSVSYKNNEGGFIAQSKDDTEKILNWYRSEVIKHGWTIAIDNKVDGLTLTNQTQAASVAILKGEKSNDVMFNVMSKDKVPVVTKDGKQDLDQVAKEVQEMIDQPIDAPDDPIQASDDYSSGE